MTLPGGRHEAEVAKATAPKGRQQTWSHPPNIPYRGLDEPPVEAACISYPPHIAKVQD